MKINISQHALFEMQRRKIPEEALRAVVDSPQTRMASRHGREILQGIYFDAHLGKDMLLRVVGVYEPDGFKVITIYKTSKFDKYFI